MTKTQTLRIRPTVQQGFTLVELMVSVTISLVLALFVSSLYISSKGSYRINDDSARLQEDGRYAMGLIGRNLMQAGYGRVVTSTTTDFVNLDGTPVQGLKGCDNGFAGPVAATPDFTCATTTGKPGFQVSYRVEDTYDANTGTGADCNGQNVSAAASVTTRLPTPGIVSNSFFLYTKAGESAPSLYCNGNGGTVAQPVLSNVEDMVLTYGVDTKGTYSPDQYLNAAAVEALPLRASNTTKWSQVVSVQVCLLLSSANNVTPQTQPYTMCNGDDGPNKDRKLRRKITSVFTLRNNAGPSLVRG